MTNKIWRANSAQSDSLQPSYGFALNLSIYTLFPVHIFYFACEFHSVSPGHAEFSGVEYSLYLGYPLKHSFPRTPREEPSRSHLVTFGLVWFSFVPRVARPCVL